MFSGRVYQLQSQLLFKTIITSKSSFHRANGRKILRSLHGCTNIVQNITNARCITSIDQARGFSTSSSDKKNFNLQYEDVLKAQKDDKVLIIDVREQGEIDETGKLPGSIHIPMGEVSKYLTTLSDDEFNKTFNKKKPTKESKIILSCRSGKRSAMVQEEITKLGYTNAYNYSGGWMDWENKQK